MSGYDSVNRNVLSRVRKAGRDGADVTSGLWRQAVPHRRASNRKCSAAHCGAVNRGLNEAVAAGRAKSSATGKVGISTWFLRTLKRTSKMNCSTMREQSACCKVSYATQRAEITTRPCLFTYLFIHIFIYLYNNPVTWPSATTKSTNKLGPKGRATKCVKQLINEDFIKTVCEDWIGVDSYCFSVLLHAFFFFLTMYFVYELHINNNKQ